MPDTPHISLAEKHVKIAHLYPEEMDLYGDIGNVLTLVRRCEWRGIQADVVEVRVGAYADIDDADILVMGGGQDVAQAFVAKDLARRGALIRDLVEDGAAALTVCGGFQLFGLEYETSAGEAIPGIGIFDAHTTASDTRLVGNAVIEARLQRHGAAHAQAPLRIVGFENHSGRTYLGSDTQPLGTVVRGAGNTGDGTLEGAVYRNAIGTYLHGPLLPKNPRLADHLIVAGLAHRYGHAEPLVPLDDVLELSAHTAAVSRCEGGRVAKSQQSLAS